MTSECLGYTTLSRFIIRSRFAIIGAAKSGTTALFQYLIQHPDVFACEPKEPHFFAFANTVPNFRGPFDEDVINRRVVTDFDAYERLFRNARDHQVLGEGSVSTLYYHKSSIENIRRYAPETKLICILRNPVERAYSAFMYLTSLTREPCPCFQKALQLESERIESGYHHMWHYRRMGLYSQQLAPFLAAFGPDQLKILIYDDFRSEPDRVVQECFEFIGVEPFVPPHRPNPLVSGQPRNVLVQSFLGRPSRWKRALREILPETFVTSVRSRINERNLKRVPMPEAARTELRQFYSEEIRKLEELVDRDLSSWTDSKPKTTELRA